MNLCYFYFNSINPFTIKVRSKDFHINFVKPIDTQKFKKEEEHSNQMTFKWVSRFIAVLDIAYVGLIYCKSYLSGFSKERAAKPKNVWKTSTVFPGRSPIPPSSSWQCKM